MRTIGTNAPTTTKQPPRPRPNPTVELLLTGTLAPNPLHFVRYVDEDAAGELRLIELEPLHPAKVA